MSLATLIIAALAFTRVQQVPPTQAAAPAGPNAYPELLTQTLIAQGGGYFPVMIRMNNGRLGVVLRGGAAHAGLGGRLDWVESSDQGRTWTSPRTIIDSPLDDRNPALGQMADGSLILAYTECSCYDPDGNFSYEFGGFKYFTVRSTTGGATWSRPEPFVPGPIGRLGSPYGRIITLDSGVSLMSVYGRPRVQGSDKYPAARQMSGVLFSRNNGRTWGAFSLIGIGYNEASLVSLGGNRVLAAVRSEAGQVFVARSTDGGHTWTPPERVTGGPGGDLPEHPADLMVLPNKWVVMVYGSRSFPFGVYAVMSFDLGKTWDYEHRLMLTNDSATADCGYPSIVLLPSGEGLCASYAARGANVHDTRAYVVRISASLLRPAKRR